MRIQLIDCERHLLDEIADKRMTRHDVALTYAMAIVSDETIDYAKVNRAIIDRWSVSGLGYIKNKARKAVGGRT